MKHSELVNGERIAVYKLPTPKNGPLAFDENITVIFLDRPEGGGLFECLSMTEYGLYIHCNCYRGRGLGKRIELASLSERCQNAVRYATTPAT